MLHTAGLQKPICMHPQLRPHQPAVDGATASSAYLCRMTWGDSAGWQPVPARGCAGCSATHADWLAHLAKHTATAEQLEMQSSSSELPGLQNMFHTSTKQQLCRTTQLGQCGKLYRQILAGGLTG